jgi:hypothetical protein
MAFFGLTQLGEQQYFRANSSTGLDLQLFVERDFRAAAERQVGARGAMPVSEVRQLLEKLYQGPLVGQHDEQLVRAHIGESATVAQLVVALLAAKEEDKRMAKEYKPTEYQSNTAMRDASRRNERLKHDPVHKFTQPVVSSHHYGWHNGTAFADKLKAQAQSFPKKASPESAFADAMAAAGAL